MSQILVIDDEKGARELFAIMVERGGYEAVKAENAYKALEYLDKTTPALIILDVMMPGMNGIELCHKLRENKGTKNVPIIILSARGDPASVEMGLHAGANDYLQKPVFQHDLLDKINTMLSG